MGWTSTYRAKGITTEQFFAELMDARYEIVASAVVNGAFYAAVRDVRTEQVEGFIALIKWSKGYWNFTYKDMGESMGPNAVEAPAKVLNALTETESQYALEWRAACRANLARKALIKTLTVGTTIELPRAQQFNDGVTRQRFTIEPKGKLRGLDGVRVGLPGWQQTDFTVIEGAAK